MSKISIVVKTIIFFVEFFIFAIVLLIAALMYGINLKNLSFSDINISALYLKYDKKLFLQAEDFSYDTHKLDFNLTLDSTADDFVLALENVVYKNQGIKFKGDIVLNANTIEQFSRDDKHLVLENFNIIFDKDLPPLLSKKLFIDTKEKDIFLSFLEPTLDRVKLDNSTISLVNLAKNGSLQINLQTPHILDELLLSVLGNYEVGLPLKQLSGKNSSDVKINIPFDKTLPISVIASIAMQNSVISVGENSVKVKKTPPSGRPKAKINIVVNIKNNTLLVKDSILHSDKIGVFLQDETTEVAINRTKIKAKDTIAVIENLRLKMKNENIHSVFDLKDENGNFISILADTNLKKQRTKGNISLHDIHYKNKVSLQNEKLSFEALHTPMKISLNGNFSLALRLKDNTTKKVSFENFVLNYLNDIATVHSNITEQNNTITVQNTTNLKENTSSGDVFIGNFDHQDIANITNQAIFYKISHEPLIANITGDIEAIIKGRKVKFENFLGHFEDNKATIDTNIIDNKNKFTLHNTSDLDTNTSNGRVFVRDFSYEDSVTLQNQSLHYSLKHFPFEATLFGDIETTLQNKLTYFKDLDIQYYANTIDTKFTYEEGNNTLLLTNKTDLDSNQSKGTAHIKSYRVDRYIDLQDEFFPYFIDFSNGLKVEIPKYKILYTNDNKKHTLKIDRLNPILDKINHIKSKKQQEGSLYFSTFDDFKNSKAIINNLGIDINSSLFEAESKDTDKNTSKKSFPNISFQLFKTNLTYDGIDFNSSAIFGKSKEEELTIKYTPKNENTNIDITKNGDNLTIKSENLSSQFIKNFTKKDIFNDGLFSVNINGNKTHLKGMISAKETTVKDVKILNNLITFVNTTPALINPILALPTLFRMSETNFDTNGYYIRDGYLNFEYNYASKVLQLPSYYTRSKMMDFKGRGIIDIKNETLHLPIDVIFLKDYSKFLNHIPILGYIITGEDGNFITNIDITGTFEKQEFETHTVKNASNGTVNVIKRTFMTPFRVFDGVKTFIEDTTKTQPKMEENKK